MDFGFSTVSSRALNLDASCSGRSSELLSLKDGLRRCMDCGSCSAVCAAASFSDFNIRRVHTLFRRGDYDALASELDKCMLCGKCTLVCPRSVNLRKMIILMRAALCSKTCDDSLMGYLEEL